MANHSSIFAWKIPSTEEPDRLQFMRPQRVKHMQYFYYIYIYIYKQYINTEKLFIKLHNIGDSCLTILNLRVDKQKVEHHCSLHPYSSQTVNYTFCPNQVHVSPHSPIPCTILPGTIVEKTVETILKNQQTVLPLLRFLLSLCLN